MISKASTQPEVLTVFEPKTGTWQYIVYDPSTLSAAIIDSVLDYEPSTNTITTVAADSLLAEVAKHNLTVTHILETHAHADHLTASRYLQETLAEKQNGVRPIISIGKRITTVQATFAAKYGVDAAELEGVFDKLWDDDERFYIGDVEAEVYYLPGHTPDHVGYRIGSNVFTGDSIFNPDVGSARCDFPGGDAEALWTSMSRLLELPGDWRLYTGHDYPPAAREASDLGPAGKERPYTTVEEQRAQNKHVKTGTKEEEFVSWRKERDATLGEPRLLHQAMQVNIRGGRLPAPTKGGDRLLKVPVKAPSWLLSA